jgi:hypothetical protein
LWSGHYIELKTVCETFWVVDYTHKGYNCNLGMVRAFLSFLGKIIKAELMKHGFNLISTMRSSSLHGYQKTIKNGGNFKIFGEHSSQIRRAWFHGLKVLNLLYP